jgi:hypothetical protein
MSRKRHFACRNKALAHPPLYPVIARFSRNATAEQIRKIIEAINTAAKAIDEL